MSSNTVATRSSKTKSSTGSLFSNSLSSAIAIWPSFRGRSEDVKDTRCTKLISLSRHENRSTIFENGRFACYAPPISGTSRKQAAPVTIVIGLCPAVVYPRKDGSRYATGGGAAPTQSDRERNGRWPLLWNP